MLVVLYFAARGGLLVARYARPRDSCSQNSTSIRRTVFTSAMYGICALLRLTEYLLLVKGVYTFLSANSHFDKKEIWRILKHVWSKRDIFWLFVLLFLVPVLLLLSVAIPIVGIVIEVQYSQITQCKDHNQSVFIAYCVFNFGRYLFASFTRLTMAFAAIEVGRIWSVAVFESPAHEAKVEQPNQTERILEDWNVCSNKFDELSQNYHQRGKKCQIICEIFKAWFIVPWITYFIATSIKTTNVLSPWLKDEQEIQVEKRLLPAIYYIMYNIFQLIALLVGYLCGLKINAYHHVYYASMRRAQRNAFNSSSRRAFAHIIRTQKIEQYDFIPHVAYAYLKIPMDNPLYMLFLLLGIFFTVGGALL